MSKGSSDKEAPWRSVYSQQSFHTSFEAKPLYLLAANHAWQGGTVCLGSTEPWHTWALLAPSAGGDPQGIGCALDHCSQSVAHVSQSLTDSKSESSQQAEMPNSSLCLEIFSE